jgi:hypothetical protein
MGRTSFDLKKKQGEMIRRCAGLAPMPSRSCDAGPLHSFGTREIYQCRQRVNGTGKFRRLIDLTREFTGF